MYSIQYESFDTAYAIYSAQLGFQVRATVDLGRTANHVMHP